MKYLFLAAFLVGLALAVHAMLHGAERWRRKRSARPSPVLNPPTVAALLVAFGATGYLLATRTSVGAVSALIAAVVAGGAAVTGMIVLMARWALKAPPGAVSPEEEEIHGQVAVVSRTITPLEPGEISYFAWGAQHVLPASSVDGSTVEEGVEVVIDRLEDGVAKVELWSVVEQRL